MSTDEEMQAIDDAWSDALAVPDGPHFMTVTIDSGGGANDVNFIPTCEAAEDAPCKLSCGEGVCEVYPCSHMPSRQKWCNVIEFLNQDTPALFDGEDGTPLASGPIVYVWDGDTYVWHFAEVAS